MKPKEVLKFEVKGATFRFRWIPPGTFMMGSPKDEVGRDDDESRHQVHITRGYWLAETPCTQAQYKAVIGSNPSCYSRYANRPVESVAWEDCREFCRKLTQFKPDWTFRLPTEAEWEYACRAGTESAFNDGSDCTNPNGKDPALGPLGWHGVVERPHPVRQKKPNAWGLYDMHGNVWEWCEDHAGWHDVDVVTDTYTDGITDPCCSKGPDRIARGGSYWNKAWLCRSAVRASVPPGGTRRSLGFRIAADEVEVANG